MEPMSRELLTMLLLLCIAPAGCNRFINKPTKQIQVPDSGPVVLTAAERSAQLPDANQPPALISRASYMRPIAERSALKPFDEWTEQDAAVDALGRIGAAAVPS